MNIVRNIAAVLLGAIACLVLNGLLLGVMMRIVGVPDGFDPNNMDSYSLLHGKYFLSPFIAHAVPSLIGGALAALLAASHKMTLALVVGGLHLIGGIAAAFMIPAPVWFIVLDLVVAYLPMAWLGGRLVVRK